MSRLLLIPFLLARLLLTIATSSQYHGVDGFADNLVLTRIGCLTELDTTEVIMNNMVLAPSNSNFPKMHLAVVVDDNHMESPYHYTISPSSSSSTSTTELTIAFVNPYSREEFPGDLQFVMEVAVEGSEGIEAPAPAQFTDGGAIGCEGNKRVAARLRDGNGLVQLQISHNNSDHLRVWAGWATGQTSVRLTPDFLLIPHQHTPAEEEKVEEEKVVGEPKGDEASRALPDEEEKDVTSSTLVSPKRKAFKSKPKHARKNNNKNKGPKGDAHVPASEVKTEEQDENISSSSKFDSEAERKMAHVKKKKMKDRHANSNSKKAKDVKQIDTNTAKKHKLKTTVRNTKEFYEAANQRNHGDNAATQKDNTASRSGASAADFSRQTTDVSDSEDAELEPLGEEQRLTKKQQADVVDLEKKRRIALGDEMMKNSGGGSFQERYESDQFADKLDMGRFFYSCAFFVLAMAGILTFVGKRKEKGRRDL